MVFGPDEQNRTSLRWISGLVVIPSLIGSFIMTIRCALQRDKKTMQNLILSIALLNFLYSIANVMSFFNHGPRTQDDITPLCYIEATIRLWAFRLPLFFAVCIAVLCYISVKNEYYQKEQNQKKFFYKSIAVGFFLCFFMNLLPLLMQDAVKYTNDYLCCTILFETSLDRHWKFLIDLLDETGLILIGIIVTIYCYYMTYKKQKQNPLMRLLSPSDIKKLNQLFWYPGVLLVLFIAGVVDRIAQIFSTQPIYEVQVFYLIFTHSAGWINALLYILYKVPTNPSQITQTESTQTHLLQP